MCGEQMYSSRDSPSPTGSPPRVRGTVGTEITTPAPARITPACAGNSYLMSHVSCFMSDHPRVCGEQEFLQEIHFPISGSPPRVRGTVQEELNEMLMHGITPACAGNS